MSGGHFNYSQSQIMDIADEVEHLIGLAQEAPEIIEKYKEGLKYLRLAYVYAQRIDWLESADDGPDSFLQRLAEDLEELK